MYEKLLNDLKKNGYTIIPGVITPDEIHETKKLFWDKLESIGSGIDRYNAETWINNNWPGNLHAGFMGNHGLSQSLAAWSIRSNKKIIDIFSQIWGVGVNDLITSMDAIICWRKWNTYPDPYPDPDPDPDPDPNNKKYFKPIVEGLHVDQSPYNEGFKCVQGMVVINEVTDRSGGLQIIPKTHTDNVQKHLRANYPWSKCNDFVELDTDDVIFKFFKPMLLKCNPGDLILWDSRLVHGGFVGTGYDIGSTDNELARLAVPVCMLPRINASPDTMDWRLDVFNQGKTTTHWPDKCNLNAITTDTHGSNIPDTIYTKPFENNQLI
jgi:hypothetical protein